MEGFRPVLVSNVASPVVSATPIISSHRAYLTYDTLRALPSKVVYSSRSAYILSRGSPRGRSGAHIVTVPVLIYLYSPSAGENEIPNPGSFSARLYSLSSMGNWVCNPDGIAALTAPRNRTGNRRVLKDGSHWQVLLRVFQDWIIETSGFSLVLLIFLWWLDCWVEINSPHRFH